MTVLATTPTDAATTGPRTLIAAPTTASAIAAPITAITPTTSAIAVPVNAMTLTTASAIAAPITAMNPVTASAIADTSVDNRLCFGHQQIKMATVLAASVQQTNILAVL